MHQTDKSDITGVSASREISPRSTDMNSPQKGVELLPESLNLLLRDVFVGKCTHFKMAAVGQAIIASSHTPGIYHTFAAMTWCSIAPSERDSLSRKVCAICCRQCWSQHTYHWWQIYFPRDVYNCCSYTQCKVTRRHTKTESNH